LENNVLQFISNNNLFQPGEKVIVAVSGGADSVCLLYILNSLKKDLSIDLHIAHLNHQLRGTESRADALYVSRLAKKLNIPATIESADVNSYCLQRKISTEEASRELRYEFFGRVISAQDAECVAVAHTRDDNVETILLHLLRGTGIAGLRGLQPHTVLRAGNERQAINVIRPLLELSRDDTEKYCSSLKLRPRVDASNNSISFTRNRIRHELIPLLTTYNTRVKDALLRLSSIARDEIDYLEEQTSLIWVDIADESDNSLLLNVSKLKMFPGVLQRQVLRQAIKHICGDIKDIEAEHIEDAVKFLKKPAGKMLTLPHGVRIHKAYNRLIINRSENAPNPFPSLKKEYALKIPGINRLPGWVIKTRISDKPPRILDKGFMASFDLDKTGTDLSVRACKKGDSFQPLGMKFSKSITRFMADARIPRQWRKSIPLVCMNDRVIWVAGWRIDESVKITPCTKKILRISFERIE